ncbi:uncharacterized protein DUF664 [Herbihabitans rhizosphaerae]|uniref:Uncharacterized protein DUF664 n=1 Tax=Herbihabitans rhizosphaerae TaxID=1872711 RepID=A0A4Q7KI19_9PSEU|nr:DinB family protein [Herbihabitans rhizosphaerae]RZS34809.1 uncharacterized protein DUF664 [Herbihabitans rhizosphaerae]
MTTPNRPDPPMTGDIREQLTGFLDYQRATVVWKASGLTDEQARKQLVTSELTTVSGLLAHLAYNEQYWFAILFDGAPDPWKDAFETDIDAEFRYGVRTPVEQLIAEYERECERSRAVAAKFDLDHEVPRGKERVNLGWVIAHMIEETARHVGHLDLLREMLDGVTGE